MGLADVSAPCRPAPRRAYGCKHAHRPFLTPRPQLFTYLFFALYLFSLLRYKYRGETRHLWGLPLIMVIWVNVHGGYLLGTAIIACFITTEWLGALLTQSPPAQRKRLHPLLLTLLLVTSASLINPWGIHHWWFPFELMGNSAVAAISEWQPLDFKTGYARAYLIAIALLLIVEQVMRVVNRWGIDASFMRFYYDCADDRARRELASTIFFFLLAVSGGLTVAAVAAAPLIAQPLFGGQDFTRPLLAPSPCSV